MHISLETLERSLITKYRKSIWAPFKNAIESYGLIQAGQSIAVCISGGKDSLLLAKLMMQLAREMPLDLHFIAMDPGYNAENRASLEQNLSALNIPAVIFKANVFEASQEMNGEAPCYWCARMRRGVLYKQAKALGCDVIALGHHMDDVVETTLMNVLHHGNFSTMLPKISSKETEGMSVIRPLYHVREQAIIKLMTYSGLTPMNCSCPITEKRTDSVRKDTKRLIDELSQTYPQVVSSIFASASHVKLDYVLGTSGKKIHSEPSPFSR